MKYATIERTAFIRIGDGSSAKLGFTSDVPEGSVLWPLLALLFISDLASFLKSLSFFFAVDVRVVISKCRGEPSSIIKVVVDRARQ